MLLRVNGLLRFMEGPMEKESFIEVPPKEFREGRRQCRALQRMKRASHGGNPDDDLEQYGHETEYKFIPYNHDTIKGAVYEYCRHCKKVLNESRGCHSWKTMRDQNDFDNYYSSKRLITLHNSRYCDLQNNLVTFYKVNKKWVDRNKLKEAIEELALEWGYMI